jgi:hypothetical protein
MLSLLIVPVILAQTPASKPAKDSKARPSEHATVKELRERGEWERKLFIDEIRRRSMAKQSGRIRRDGPAKKRTPEEQYAIMEHLCSFAGVGTNGDARGLQSATGKYLPSLDLRAESIGVLRWPNRHGPYASQCEEGNSFKVIQVINEANMLVRFNQTLLWASGESTISIVDDTEIALGGVWKCAGTQRYETATGTRTVFKIEFLAKSLDELNAKLLASDAQPQPSP